MKYYVHITLIFAHLVTYTVSDILNNWLITYWQHIHILFRALHGKVSVTIFCALHRHR